jgi:DNA (cytosine-5)-methyltransferase 1
VPTLKNGSTVGIPSPPAVLMPDGRVIKPDIRDAERLQGFPEDWTRPCERAARASLRWSLVGNAVTVPVAEWLGRRLAEPGVYTADRDGNEICGGRWPAAARGEAGEHGAVNVGKTPEYHARLPLHEFLRHSGEPLSVRATNGFLRRADAGSLRFVEGFKDRVRAHMAAMETAPIAAQ